MHIVAIAALAAAILVPRALPVRRSAARTLLAMGLFAFNAFEFYGWGAALLTVVAAMAVVVEFARKG